MGHVAAISQHPAPAEPVYYVWSFPGSPIKVRLDLDVVRRMQRRFPGAGAVGWGLLTGVADGQTTTVSGFRALLVGDAAEVERAVADLKQTPGEQLLVGYYRTQQEDGLRLNEDDLALAQTFFSDPHHVFLLIQPADEGPANASFFFWDGGRMTGDFPFLEFPFDAALLANTERRRTEATQLRALVSARAETAPPQQPVSRNRAPASVVNRERWIIAAACLAVAAVIGAIGVWLFPLASARLLHRAPGPAPSAQSAQLPVPPEQPSIGFAAERQNGDLKLTWRRDSEVIRSATSGVLTIQDGTANRQIKLLAGQVRGGSILYSPVSDQVQVQLTVSAPTVTATESVIVINPRVGAPKVQALSSNAVSASADRPQPPPSAASKPAPLKTFALPAAAAPARTPGVVLDAPPALAAISNPTVARPDAILNRQSPLAPRQPATPAPPAAPVEYPPEVATTAMPAYPTGGQVVIREKTTVEVAVAIDVKGRVVKTALVPGQQVHPLLVAAAMDAARRWTFKPARSGDQPIPSAMVLRFDFNPKR